MYDRKWAEKNLSPYKSINEFVHLGLKKTTICNRYHFLPQLSFIIEARVISVNFINRYEHLKEGWDQLVN